MAGTLYPSFDASYWLGGSGALSGSNWANGYIENQSNGTEIALVTGTQLGGEIVFANALPDKLNTPVRPGGTLTGTLTSGGLEFDTSNIYDLTGVIETSNFTLTAGTFDIAPNGTVGAYSFTQDSGDVMIAGFMGLTPKTGGYPTTIALSSDAEISQTGTVIGVILEHSGSLAVAGYLEPVSNDGNYSTLDGSVYIGTDGIVNIAGGDALEQGNIGKLTVAGLIDATGADLNLAGLVDIISTGTLELHSGGGLTNTGTLIDGGLIIGGAADIELDDQAVISGTLQGTVSVGADEPAKSFDITPTGAVLGNFSDDSGSLVVAGFLGAPEASIDLGSAMISGTVVGNFIEFGNVDLTAGGSVDVTQSGTAQGVLLAFTMTLSGSIYGINSEIDDLGGIMTASGFIGGVGDQIDVTIATLSGTVGGTADKISVETGTISGAVGGAGDRIDSDAGLISGTVTGTYVSFDSALIITPTGRVDVTPSGTVDIAVSNLESLTVNGYVGGFDATIILDANSTINGLISGQWLYDDNAAIYNSNYATNIGILGSISVTRGGSIGGTSIFNNGSITVTGGSLNVNAPLNGDGDIVIAGTSALYIDNQVANGQTLTFEGASSDLYVGALGSFAPKILGFRRGNTIDVAGVVVNNVTYDDATNQFLLQNISSPSSTVTVGSLDLADLDPNTVFSVESDGNGGTEISPDDLWPTDPLVVTLDSGGNWSSPDANGNSFYIGTVTIGLTNGENLLQVEGATIERDEDDLLFSDSAIVYSLIGSITVPILQGPFTLAYEDATADPMTDQPSYLAQLPATVELLQLEPEAISIDYALPLPSPFDAVTVPDLSPSGSYDLDITNNGFQLGGPSGVLALPGFANANFYNIFTASFSDGAISVTPSGSAVHIQGEIVTGSPVRNSVSTTVTLNIAGSHYIGLSDYAGTIVFGADFAFSVENLTLPGGWGLQDLSGTLDTYRSTISLGASLEIPFNAQVDVGLVGSIGFSYNPWQLNEIGLGITLTGHAIPIPGTPLFINSVAGTLENLAPTATSPITLAGALGFDVGPTVANFDLGNFSVSGSYIAGQSFTAGVVGQFGVFGGTALGTLTGSETFNWATDTASGAVALSLLANSFNGSMTFTQSPSAFSFSGAGALTIPSRFTVFGESYSVPSLLVGKSLSVNLAGNYDFGGGGGNLSASGTLALGAVSFALLGTYDITITAGLQIALPCSTSGGGLTIDGALTATPVVTVADARPAAEISTVTEALPVESGLYNVAAGSSVLILSASWTHASASAPALSLIEPYGTLLSESEFGAAGILDVTSLDNATSENIAILTPQAGTYQLEIDDSTSLGTVNFNALAQGPNPTLTLAVPIATSVGGWKFGWSASNIPQDATITFYAASEATTFDGTPISGPLTASTSGQFVWDGSGVPPGSYYVYGELDAEGVPPVDAYASNQALAVVNAQYLEVGLVGPGTIAAAGTATLDVQVSNLGTSDVSSTSVLLQTPPGFKLPLGQAGISADGSSWLIETADIPAGGTTDVAVLVTADGSAAGQTSTFDAAINSTSFNAATTGNSASLVVAELPCFAAGTRISLWHGDTDVAAIAIGDVVKLHNGRSAPVKWIGRRKIDCIRHPGPNKIWPVCVRAGAFDEGKPSRDLWLSPDHAVLVGGSLVPIKHLINGYSVAQIATAQVEYWHIELDRHDILLAEGLPCESYIDTGNRTGFDNGRDPIALHPDFSPLTWKNACAPLIQDGPLVLAEKQRLFDRAGLIARPHRPSVCITAKDRVLGGRALGRGLLSYNLPRNSNALHLTSAVWMPASQIRESLDARLLGVRLLQVWIDGRLLTLDDAAFGCGFYPIEPSNEGFCRWTNGNAFLILRPAATKITLRVADNAIPFISRRSDFEHRMAVV